MPLLTNLTALLQILVIDISLAGDNALAVGLAASGLPPTQRHRAVLAGILAATTLRVLFALFAVRLLHFTGLMLAGGLLLLWVAWKMVREIRHRERSNSLPPRGAGLGVGGVTHSHKPAASYKKLSTAIWQIVAADVSMSLDNVLAVAGVARDHIPILVIGLLISIFLMGAAATLIAKLTHRYPRIAYLGIAIVFFTALRMVWDGIRRFVV